MTTLRTFKDQTEFADHDWFADAEQAVGAKVKRITQADQSEAMEIELHDGTVIQLSATNVANAGDTVRVREGKEAMKRR